MSLSSLPAELLALIIRDTDSATQAVLSLVNRRFYAVASPILYAAHPEAILLGARAGNLDTVQRAIELGADINVRGPNDMMAIAKAAAPPFDRRQFASLACASSLHYAAKNGDYAMAKWLLDHGANIDAPSWCLCRCETYPSGPVDERDPEMRENPHPYFRRRWTPLHAAICHRQITVVKLLVARGASMTVDAWRHRYRMRSTMNPANTAADDDDLLNPHRLNRPNATALHWSAACGLKSIVRELVVSGKVDVNCVAMDDETPLYYACLASPDPSVVSLLLELGADATITSRAIYHKTALMAACDNGNCAAALVLLKERGDDLFGLPNMESFLRAVKKPFLIDFSSESSEPGRKELEAAQAELCSRLLDLICRKVTDRVELENVLEDLFISAAWSQSPASPTVMRQILRAGVKLKPGGGVAMAALKHALSQSHPNILHRKVELLFEHGADARVSDDPFLGLECPLTWFLGHMQRRNPNYLSSRPWNLSAHAEAYVAQAVHTIRSLLRHGAMENTNEYGATACERFLEIIRYEGENEVLTFAARVLAQNFKIALDAQSGKRILVDRIPDSEVAISQAQEDARWGHISV